MTTATYPPHPYVDCFEGRAVLHHAELLERAAFAAYLVDDGNTVTPYRVDGWRTGAGCQVLVSSHDDRTLILRPIRPGEGDDRAHRYYYVEGVDVSDGLLNSQF